MQFRHEIKHEISYHDMMLLQSRLKSIMKVDSHAIDSRYEIRSLYFDNLDDKALREKLDGVNIREKFRIRLYNMDLSYIKLERKFKYMDLGYKDSVSLTSEQASWIAKGDYEWMKGMDNEVLLGFYTRLRNECLKAKVIVDYTRIPFVYGPGNVRVTLDFDIRTGLGCTDFLNPEVKTVPVNGSPCILEVKWDNFLPNVIRDAVQLESRSSCAFSKYASCRMYD